MIRAGRVQGRGGLECWEEGWLGMASTTGSVLEQISLLITVITSIIVIIIIIIAAAAAAIGIADMC